MDKQQSEFRTTEETRLYKLKAGQKHWSGGRELQAGDTLRLTDRGAKALARKVDRVDDGGGPPVQNATGAPAGQRQPSPVFQGPQSPNPDGTPKAGTVTAEDAGAKTPFGQTAENTVDTRTDHPDPPSPNTSGKQTRR